MNGRLIICLAFAVQRNFQTKTCSIYNLHPAFLIQDGVWLISACLVSNCWSDCHKVSQNMKALSILCLWYQQRSAWNNDLDIQFLLRIAAESSVCSGILFEIRNCDIKLSTRLYFSFNVFINNKNVWKICLRSCTSDFFFMWISLLGVHTCGIVICSTDADVFSHFSDARSCLLPVWQRQNSVWGAVRQTGLYVLTLYFSVK